MNAQWLQIVGRLKPGVPQEQVRAELDMLYKQPATANWLLTTDSEQLTN